MRRTALRSRAETCNGFLVLTSALSSTTRRLASHWPDLGHDDIIFFDHIDLGAWGNGFASNSEEGVKIQDERVDFGSAHGS